MGRGEVPHLVGAVREGGGKCGGAAGEEEPAGAEIEELAVQRGYLLPENWPVGITHLVSLFFLYLFINQ